MHLETESDSQLLARISLQAADPKSARAAQAVFYSRHVRFLYGLLLRRKTDLLPLAGISAEDLVQETFHRAFERAHTFREGEEFDSERALARTRAWLSRVATNLLADQLHRLREISATPYLERVSCEAIEEPEPTSRPSRVDLVAQGLEELSEREQDVLRVSALYFKAGEEHNRLPNAVSADLAQRWQTTNENIRAVRARAMKKLKAFLTAKGLGTEEVS